jgi:hypothetical protein
MAALILEEAILLGRNDGIDDPWRQLSGWNWRRS